MSFFDIFKGKQSNPEKDERFNFGLLMTNSKKTITLELKESFLFDGRIYHFTVLDSGSSELIQKFFHYALLTGYAKHISRKLPNALEVYYLNPKEAIIKDSIYTYYKNYPAANTEDWISYDQAASECLSLILSEKQWLLSQKKIRYLNIGELKIIIENSFYRFFVEAKLSEKFPIAKYCPFGICLSTLTAWKYFVFLTESWDIKSRHYKNLVREYDMTCSTNWASEFRGRFYDYDPVYRRETELKLLANLITLLGRIPEFSEMNFMYMLSPKVLEEFINGAPLNLFENLSKLVSIDFLMKTEKTWFEILCNSGVLLDAKRETKYGTMVKAKDGHVCRSISEKNVCDWLYDHQIKHEKEVKFPNSNFISDWKIGNIYIELFGLKGQKTYDEKTVQKIKLAENLGIELIELYLEDLQRLDKKLGRFK
jgi:hypothetical protein